jgi:hypothetical protein
VPTRNLALELLVAPASEATKGLSAPILLVSKVFAATIHHATQMRTALLVVCVTSYAVQVEFVTQWVLAQILQRLQECSEDEVLQERVCVCWSHFTTRIGETLYLGQIVQLGCNYCTQSIISFLRVAKTYFRRRMNARVLESNKILQWQHPINKFKYTNASEHLVNTSTRTQ